jgi:predicted amidohydrolase
MQDLRLGAAQFEHRDDDQAYNLDQIRTLTAEAAEQGAQLVSFHECSISGYTFLQHLDRPAMIEVAERVPDGPSTQSLIAIAKEHQSVVMAGLVEIDDDKIYNTYVTAGPDGLITRFRKLHPFVSPHMDPGPEHHVIDLLGAKIGFLICYDNNLPENARATALMGAEILIAPHVTMCTPSPMPGRGEVDPALWDNRKQDPDALRCEFDGPKGREWLMRWLPARAWENGLYIVFTNPIGRDADTIKPGLSMVIDPCGQVQAECRSFENEVVVTDLTAELQAKASGSRYLAARRPELYTKLTEPHPLGHNAVTDPGWKLAHRPD